MEVPGKVRSAALHPPLGSGSHPGATAQTKHHHVCVAIEKHVFDKFLGSETVEITERPWFQPPYGSRALEGNSMTRLAPYPNSTYLN